MSSEWRLKLYRGKYAAVRKADGGTERRSLRTGDRATAEQRFLDFKAQTVRPMTTVGEYVAAYLTEKDKTARSPKSLHAAWKAAAYKFAALRPDQINRDLCRAYIAERTTARRKPGTIKKEIETIRSALNFFKITGAVFEIPPPPPPKDRVLSRDEFRALLWTKTARTYPHLRAAIALALGTAARISALLDLTWDRVDFANGIIQLATEDEHGRKRRASVPMTTRVRRYLLVLKKNAVSRHVIEYGGHRIYSIRNGFRQACADAGIKGVTPHTLRHSAATWMALAGVPMVQIARYLGHSDDRLTQRRYAHLSPEYLRNAAKALD